MQPKPVALIVLSAARAPSREGPNGSKRLEVCTCRSVSVERRSTQMVAAVMTRCTGAMFMSRKHPCTNRADSNSARGLGPCLPHRAQVHQHASQLSMGASFAKHESVFVSERRPTPRSAGFSVR